MQQNRKSILCDCRDERGLSEKFKILPHKQVMNDNKINETQAFLCDFQIVKDHSVLVKRPKLEQIKKKKMSPGGFCRSSGSPFIKKQNQ